MEPTNISEEDDKGLSINDVTPRDERRSDLNIFEEDNESELEDILNIKQAEKDDIELTVNEQIRRVQIILSGIASILLVNITAAIIIVLFDPSFSGDVRFKSRNYLKNQEKGMIQLLWTLYACVVNLPIELKGVVTGLQ